MEPWKSAGIAAGPQATLLPLCAESLLLGLRDETCFAAVSAQLVSGATTLKASPLTCLDGSLGMPIIVQRQNDAILDASHVILRAAGHLRLGRDGLQLHPGSTEADLLRDVQHRLVEAALQAGQQLLGGNGAEVGPTLVQGEATEAPLDAKKLSRFGIAASDGHGILPWKRIKAWKHLPEVARFWDFRRLPRGPGPRNQGAWERSAPRVRSQRRHLVHIPIAAGRGCGHRSRGERIDEIRRPLCGGARRKAVESRSSQTGRQLQGSPGHGKRAPG
mmetsp:Transcript_73044/g.174199  ORF Transcript_73044/g.174199 Transcript_73044/m.174199 type:complete len:275 (+) Transcript_73044:533-1357(+)